jgi:arylsulfatase
MSASPSGGSREGTFTGTVKEVTFDLAPHAHGDELALHQHHALQAVAHGAAG